MTRPHVDVAVVGGGPAGCATAIGLVELGVDRVVVFDAGRRRLWPVGESLPPEARLLLHRLGVWEQFATGRHEPCLGSCSSWGSPELGYNDFVLNPYGAGWHLDRAAFDAMLVRRAADAGVEWHTGRVDRVVAASRGGFVVGDDPGLEARFVVDATGSAARVGRQLGAVRRRHDRLTCVAAFFDARSAPLGRLTMLEAVPGGWWYAARLPGGRAVAMMATDHDLVSDRDLTTGDGWRDALHATAHVGPALAGATVVDGSLTVRSAPSAVADPAAGDGWLAVGDAAASHDPLSALGIHASLEGGLDAATAISAWLAGDPTGLDRYRDAVGSRFDEYLANRRYLYALERRWDGPFWQRRRSRERVARMTGLR